MADDGHAPVDVNEELRESPREVVHEPIWEAAQGGLQVLGELTVVVFLELACTQGQRCQVRHSMLIGKSQVGVGTSRSSLVQSQPLPAQHTLLRMALKRSRTELPW